MTKPQSLPNTLIGDLVIRQQTFEALSRQAASSGQPCYGYYFTYTSSYSPIAAHAADINFVFGNLGPQEPFGGTQAPTAQDYELSKAIMSYWTNFAKFGNPNGLGGIDLPEWPPFHPGQRQFLQLGVQTGPVEDIRFDRFNFIASLRRWGVLPSTWRSLEHS